MGAVVDGVPAGVEAGTATGLVATVPGPLASRSSQEPNITRQKKTEYCMYFMLVSFAVSGKIHNNGNNAK